MAIATAAAIGATALPYLMKLLKLGKTAYKSKSFVPGLGYGFLGGSMLLGAAGQRGERGLTREQLKLQTLMAKASGEATKRTVKESRANTKKYITALMKAQREERREERDMEAMRSFTASQDRQMALVLQAMQAIGQRQPGAGGAGMMGLMRGGF
ncbi:hypothetical protein LCGC14_0647860 [marine sediment metagenome]|uniref:Uncharacterized protein n=1 Tax=marine sediment metagenome TaxID=412755 RepID=A0A0F9RGU2_9ZZZZ